MNNIKLKDKYFPFSKYIDHDILLISINYNKNNIKFYLDFDITLLSIEFIKYNQFYNYYMSFYHEKDNLKKITEFLEPKYIYYNSNKNIVILYCLEEDLINFNNKFINADNKLLLDFLNDNETRKGLVYNILDMHKITYIKSDNINILLLKIFIKLLNEFILKSISIYENIKINIDSNNKYLETILYDIVYENHSNYDMEKYNILYYFTDIYTSNKYILNDYNNRKICSICLEKLEDKQIVLTNCCHLYHKDCILNMIKINNNIDISDDQQYFNNIKCPECRTTIYTYLVFTLSIFKNIIKNIIINDNINKLKKLKKF